MVPRASYERELGKLHADVEEMGLEVQKLYIKTFWAYEKKDKDKLIAITKSDRDIRVLQRNIESSCLNLITKQQPIARDLRQVTATLKVVNDISRIGEQCVDIAELFLRMDMKEVADFSPQLKDMAEKTREQLVRAADTFVQKDTMAAAEVVEKDDEVDDLFNLVKDDLVCHLKEGVKDTDSCIDILMIAKHLEKIGDHAVNIAEWAIFSVTGEINKVRLL